MKRYLLIFILPILIPGCTLIPKEMISQAAKATTFVISSHS